MRNIETTDVNFINLKSARNGGGFCIQDMSGKLSLTSTVPLAKKIESFEALNLGSFLYSVPIAFEFSIKNYLV